MLPVCSTELNGYLGEVRMSDYALVRMAIGSNERVSISHADYQEAAKCMALVYAILDIERSFDLVVRSFVEFEKSLLNSAIDYMVQPSVEPYHFTSAIQDHLLRLVSILTICRMYFDQTDKTLKSKPLDELNLNPAFAQWRGTHYDESFSFRLMEALRNFAQHDGQAVHGLTHGSEWIGEDSERKMVFSTSVLVDPKIVREASRLKASFREELQKHDKSFDVKAHVREYIERLGKIQADLRSELRHTQESAVAFITRQIESFENIAIDRSSIGLAALEMNDDDTGQNPIYLRRNSLDLLTRLQRLNGLLMNLSKRYASSEVRGEGAKNF